MINSGQPPPGYVKLGNADATGGWHRSTSHSIALPSNQENYVNPGNGAEQAGV